MRRRCDERNGGGKWRGEGRREVRRCEERKGGEGRGE